MRIQAMAMTCMLLAAAGQAAPRYVATNGPGPYPFDSWETAAADLEAAVNAAGAGDTVWVSNGVYVLTNTIAPAASVSIVGTGGVVTVDGADTYRCFAFGANATGQLVNLHIVRGYAPPADPHGGGVYLYQGALVNCVLSNNAAATNGGGLYVNRAAVPTVGTCLVQQCEFVENRAANGAGAYFTHTNNLVLTADGCTFRTNIAGTHGGGVYAWSTATAASMLFTNCTFQENRANGGNGGGAYPYAATFADCRFLSNYAYTYGGGAGGDACRAIYFLRCRFQQNYGREYGGGLALYSSGSATACTIASNECPGIGGGMRGGGGVYLARTGVTLRDCLITGNTARNGGGILATGGNVWNSLVADNVCLSSTDYGGAGICNSSQNYAFKAYNCTLAGNYTAGSKPGGLEVQNATQVVQFENSILYGNSNSVPDSDHRNYRSLDTATMAFTNCCFAPALTNASATYSVSNTTADARFENPAAGDYRISALSPCFNTGANRTWMTNATDLAGARRIIFDTVDMGCYKYRYHGTIFMGR